MTLKNADRNSSSQNLSRSAPVGDAVGFTLIEVALSMVILLVALLGVIVVFGFAVNYNSGNNARSEALAILQQEVEQLRSLKFTSTAMDARLAGGTKAPKIVTMAGGNRFRVNIVIDDDPTVAGVQTDNNKTLKEITISVTNTRVGTNDWREGFATSTVFRRVRGN